MSSNNTPLIVTGTSFFTKQIVDSTMRRTHMVDAADLDGDGDIDLVSTAERDDTVAWFENDGTLGFTKRIVDETLNQAYPVSLKDIDDDGDVDILAAGFGDDKFVIYTNDGTGNFVNQVVLISDGPHSIFAIDMDDDGDQDLVTSSQTAGNATWYENDGNENFTLHIIDPDLDRAKTAIPADVDSDGDIDVIGTSNDDDTVVWYENDGNQTFVKHIVDDNVLGAYYAVAADLDGDGDQDITSVGQTDNTLAWYRNDGSENFQKIVIDTTLLGARAVHAADIDSDGDVDLFATAADGNVLNLYENDGIGNFTGRFVDPNIDGSYGVETFDVNQDGLLDVLSAARDSAEIAIHIQSKAHTANLAGGETLEIDTGLLQAIDPDTASSDLIYTVLASPQAGELRLADVALTAGSTFTQADIDQNRLSYVHLSLPVSSDEFRFSLTDGNSTPQTGSFNIDIVSTPPNATDDSAMTDEDQSVVIDALFNDSDSEGREIAIVSTSDPANGSAIIDDNGTPTDSSDDTILYTPDSNFFGVDNFSYVLRNSQGGEDTATVTVTVNSLDDNPVANDDIVSSSPGEAVVINVLANDTDGDGDLLSIASVADGANGVVTDNGNGTLTYVPNDPNFSGQDTFNYTITDNNSGTDTATVTVNVTPFPIPFIDLPDPIEFDGSNSSVVEEPHSSIYEIPEGTIVFSFIAANTSGNKGLFTKDASGFVGGGNHFASYLDGATLKARFQDGVESQTLSVGGIVPGVTYDVAATFGSGGVAIYLDGTLVASNPLVMDWTRNVEYLQWGGRGWGSDSGQPGFNAPFNGSMTNRQIYDTVLSASEVAELHADGPVNTNPIAVDDNIVVLEDTEITFDPAANDSDSDGDNVVVGAIATNPANGTAVLNPDLTVTYTPDANYFGSDSFEVSVLDGNGGTATSEVNVTVTGVDDDPIAVDDTASSQSGETIALNLLLNDLDPDGDPLTLTNIAQPANGTVSDNGDGTVSYTSNPAFIGSDNFSYTVSDSSGRSSTATATIEVTEEASFPLPQFEQPGVNSYSGSAADVDNFAHDPLFEIPEGTVAFSFIADDPNARQGLVSKDASGFEGGGNHFAALVRKDNLIVRFQDGDSSETFVAKNLVAGQEYEVAAVFGEGVQLWVDGILIGENPDFTSDWTLNREYLQIGGLGWGSDTGSGSFTNPFAGQIADVEIYAEALSPDQIMLLAGESSLQF